MSTASAVDRGLLGLFAEHVGARATGVITAVRANHKRLFCLERGTLVYALSNVIEEQFGATLARTGVLPADAVAQATRLATERNLKLAALLTEQGTPDAAALARAMNDHVRWLFGDTVDWDNAELSFEKGRPNIDGEPLAIAHGTALVFEHTAKARLSPQELRMRIGPPDMRPLLVRRRRNLLADAGPDDAIDQLLAQCTGDAGIEELIAGFDVPADVIVRRLYALVLLGMIEHSTPTVAKRQDGLPTFDECVARYDAAENADHYGVLSLTRSSKREDVRESYYYLAKRFHPDRLRSPELMQLSARSEDFFARVTEAYNTLYDPELRAAYDKQQEEASAKTERDPTMERGYIAKQNYARGKTLIDKGRYQDAIQFFENAIEQDGSVPLYQLELGRVLIRNPRRRRDAEKLLVTAIDLDPTLVEAYLALGQLLRKLNRDDEAVDRFREVLRWDPNHALAKAELAEMGEKETATDGGLLRGWFKK